MTAAEFNIFCATLPHAHHVVQWGGADVWKIGGKVFAIGGWNESEALCVSFKCSDISFQMLKVQPGIRPAPYLASRGMTWLQRTGSQTMSDADLKGCLKESYRLVSLGLTKVVKKTLGLNLNDGAKTSIESRTNTAKIQRSKRDRV